MKSITHEFTNFNAEHLSKKTEAEFIAEFENTPVYQDYSPEDRLRLFKEAYAECRKAMGLPPVIAPASAPANDPSLTTDTAPSETNTERPAGRSGKKSEDK